MSDDALAEVTVARVLEYVDHLANTRAPNPRGTIGRPALITDLRTKLTSAGRPLDTAIWADVVDQVQRLRTDLGDEPARTGSVEQILNAWARDLVAADAESREIQERHDHPPTGLSPDTLLPLLRRLEHLRAAVAHHLRTESPHHP